MTAPLTPEALVEALAPALYRSLYPNGDMPAARRNKSPGWRQASEQADAFVSGLLAPLIAERDTATAEAAQLRAEVEAKDRALKEIEGQSRRWIRRDRVSPGDVVVRDDSQHSKVLALNGIGRIAQAARAATAREGA